MTTIVTTITPNLQYHPHLSRMKFDGERRPDPIRVTVDVGMNTLSISATGPTGQIIRHCLDIPMCFRGASRLFEVEAAPAVPAELPPRREAYLTVDSPSKAVFTQVAAFGRVDVELHAFDAIKIGSSPISLAPVM